MIELILHVVHAATSPNATSSSAQSCSRSERVNAQSPNSDHLVHLQAETPSRVRQTILQGALCIDVALWAVHRLNEKMLKLEVFKHFWISTDLRKHQFE